MKNISIIIPIYNVENYLTQCLDSVFSQISPSMEVILVNDGSTDNSLSICQEYQKKYPETILVNKKNGGLSDARNAGTDIASGKYVFYLDSDDWLTPNSIQQLYDFAEKNQCEVVQGNFYYSYNDYLLFDERYIKGNQPPFVLNKQEAMKELIKNEYVKNFAWGKLILTSIAKKYPFKEGVFFEDAYWKHHIIHETNRYGVLPIPVCYYRQREGSISGNFSIRNLDLLKGYEERFRFIQENYPQYIQQMKEIFWKTTYSFVRIANNSTDNQIREKFLEFKDEMVSKYPPSLTIKTKNSFIYSFCKRVYTHFFSRSLTYIKR